MTNTTGPKARLAKPLAAFGLAAASLTACAPYGGAYDGYATGSHGFNAGYVCCGNPGAAWYGGTGYSQAHADWSHPEWNHPDLSDPDWNHSDRNHPDRDRPGWTHGGWTHGGWSHNQWARHDEPLPGHAPTFENSFSRPGGLSHANGFARPAEILGGLPDRAPNAHGFPRPNESGRRPPG